MARAASQCGLRPAEIIAQNQLRRDLPDLLSAGDGMAQRLVEETGKWIGVGVMHVIRVRPSRSARGHTE